MTSKTYNRNYQRPRFSGARFLGIDPVFPEGTRGSPTYVHPNSARIWAGKL